MGVLGGIGFAAYRPVMSYLEQRNKTQWRTQAVEQGEIIQAVNSTGKVEPIKRVSVGATVSGPIAELLVDFNTKVSKDQVLAKIDPRLYTSARSSEPEDSAGRGRPRRSDAPASQER